MIPRPKHLSRRRFLTWLGGASLLPLLPGVPAGANPAGILTRPIPSSGEAIPAVTCAIPATTRVEHMVQNMGAAYGALPDEALRRRMLADFAVA
ncbi:hypothetical protein [Thioalkalivibrio sulfidiphilus]|uniref:hypothetical protein n=1 Tax=Thioalkalivibrio sulfidiphilus TaxID=1033854 RepID=UPI00036ED06C